MNKIGKLAQSIQTFGRLRNQPKQIDPSPTWKRSLDLAGAACGLLMLSPLLLLIALHIKLFSRGPVLFKHKRYGYRGEPLFVWKFRSMHTAADPSDHQKHVLNMVQGNVQLKKLQNDSQLIFLGKYLRCSGVDELPQLINVLKGEMSLVGPRPDVIPLDQYEEWQKTRFEVLPGLTGLWQVSGKNHTTFTEMNQLDLCYVDKRSFWLDLKIVMSTPPAILRQIAEEFSSKYGSN